MKASELINGLQKQIEVFGDLDVVLWTDQGESQVSCTGAGPQTVEGSDKKVMEIWGEGVYRDLSK